jgi:hypothetical protein
MRWRVYRDWDRNYLVMAAALYSESLFLETGHKVDANVFDFWDENCVVISYRNRTTTLEPTAHAHTMMGQRSLGP